MRQITTYSLANRILHWLIAFTFLLILFTVFLRTGWMNKNEIASIVTTKLAEKNVSISKEDAIIIGRAVRKPMWDIHIYAGYLLIGLYLLRMLVIWIEAPIFRNPMSKGSSRKEKLKLWIYIVFYICLGISLLTGAILELVPKTYSLPLHDTAKFIHLQSLYYALAFITIHLLGVVIAELSTEPGIISKMIHGRRSGYKASYNKSRSIK
jgi:cytochrome b561